MKKSQETKYLIIGDYLNGQTVKDIAQTVQKSESYVRHIITNWKKQG